MIFGYLIYRTSLLSRLLYICFQVSVSHLLHLNLSLIISLSSYSRQIILIVSVEIHLCVTDQLKTLFSARMPSKAWFNSTPWASLPHLFFSNIATLTSVMSFIRIHTSSILVNTSNQSTNNEACQTSCSEAAGPCHEGNVKAPTFGKRSHAT